MAKAKLTNLTQSWINSKTQKSNNVKTSKHQTANLSKSMQTIYISSEAKKLLWQKRVETGDSLSSTIETLILTYLKK